MALQGTIPNPAPHQYVATYILCAINVLNIARRFPGTFVFYIGPQREFQQVQALVMLNNSSLCRRIYAANPQSNVFHFPDTTLDTFQQLYNWMSNGSPSHIADDVAFQGLTNTAVGIRKMIKIYIAAHKLGCNAMEDLLIGLLGIGYFRSGLSPSAGDIDLAFAETAGLSSLCDYMTASFNIRLMNWQIQPPNFVSVFNVARLYTKIQTDFFQMIGDAALQDRRILRPRDLKDYTICDYHSHGDGAGCWAATHTFGSHPFLG
jgi:hypothetical protein